MKLSELEAKLAELREEHGDIEVMIRTDGESVYGMDMCSFYHTVAEEGDYPEDWQMPAGFEFIEMEVMN